MTFFEKSSRRITYFFSTMALKTSLSREILASFSFIPHFQIYIFYHDEADLSQLSIFESLHHS